MDNFVIKDLEQQVRILEARIVTLEGSLKGSRDLVDTLMREVRLVIDQRDHHRRWSGRWKRIARDLKKNRGCGCGR